MKNSNRVLPQFENKPVDDEALEITSFQYFASIIDKENESNARSFIQNYLADIHDPNIDTQSDAECFKNFTPLMYACLQNKPEYVKTLLEYGAHVNYENKVCSANREYAYYDPKKKQHLLSPYTLALEHSDQQCLVYINQYKAYLDAYEQLENLFCADQLSHIVHSLNVVDSQESKNKITAYQYRAGNIFINFCIELSDKRRETLFFKMFQKISLFLNPTPVGLENIHTYKYGLMILKWQNSLLYKVIEQIYGFFGLDNCNNQSNHELLSNRLQNQLSSDNQVCVPSAYLIVPIKFSPHSSDQVTIYPAFTTKENENPQLFAPQTRASRCPEQVKTMLRPYISK